uniref:t-SNARE coiled-coil homology domain-containing protein n=1 Tax=Spumella elongata TaxID=89044 RepID=A0A7S3HCT8_9STRA|mmetsp:Transcript_46134/g.80665  ORF Transcript_46134/g.80665 Transcript_46134/m.80665 type:complete len:355 (+) Transcript_46134:55-1119(+)|eukprot:CAMPEP_0184977040 /NCGR_PEP_ID=MMETSP1098-20130426/7821_1 /TAXON_ID=89044 /ORGANISM="Spumella elongata, Strain CCAP 955/1" /LENGTH=354 /DNA_ID=CAMNT_0027499985 /DNA_START=71 /DNA_END=1135 /DNA_ORIENTATION=+
MTTVDRRAANLKKLREADELQEKTKESIARSQRMAEEAEGLGAQTLDELRRQGEQMNDINAELDAVDAKLDTSKSLQAKFDAWAGNWFGGKRRMAAKEAAQDIKTMSQADHFAIKEVFQHEKFDLLTRQWQENGMVLCTDTSIPCNDVFDPVQAEQMENSRWIVDFTLSGIDSDGWTYAFDLKTLNKVGSGDAAPKWNSYVRRRKWRMVDRTGKGGAASGLDELHQRNDERKLKANNNRPVEKIGYVTRNKQAEGMKASGFSSAAMMGKQDPDQDLDEESAAGLSRLRQNDSEIDSGVAQLSRTIDTLGSIGAAMKDEVLSQNAKLERMENSMQRGTEKQVGVNSVLRQHLKSN